MRTPDDQKRAAGEAAAALVKSGMVVGLGTGSTAAWFVRALAARKLDIVGVPTSQATADLATSLGIRIASLGETKTIDLTVDGADEVGPGLSLIKGGVGDHHTAFRRLPDQLLAQQRRAATLNQR